MSHFERGVFLAFLVSLQVAIFVYSATLCIKGEGEHWHVVFVVSSVGLAWVLAAIVGSGAW